MGHKNPLAPEMAEDHLRRTKAGESSQWLTRTLTVGDGGGLYWIPSDSQCGVSFCLNLQASLLHSLQTPARQIHGTNVPISQPMGLTGGVKEQRKLTKTAELLRWLMSESIQ